MFAAEFEPAESLPHRGSPRAPVSLDARLGRGGLDRTLCRVVDLSRRGARLETYSMLRVGSMIWLTLPHIGMVAAEITWSDDFIAGCRFRVPLDEHVFEMLVAHDQHGYRPS